MKRQTLDVRGAMLAYDITDELLKCRPSLH
jgi:hypothetical protein